MRVMSPAARLIVVAACGLVLAAAVSPLAAKEDRSGFLSDYSELKKEKDPLGRDREIWLSPKLTRENYQKVLIDPMTFHPKPEPTKSVPDQTLTDTLAHLDAALKKAVGAEVPLVDAAGPGVVRLRAAITAVDVKKALKAYEYIPIGLVAAGVTEAAGVRKHDVHMYVEAELTDSVTNESLARIVRETKGVKLKGHKDVLTADDFKAQIDEWGEAVQRMVEIRLKEKQAAP